MAEPPGRPRHVRRARRPSPARAARAATDAWGRDARSARAAAATSRASDSAMRTCWGAASPARRTKAVPRPAAPPGSRAASSVPSSARLSAGSVTRRLIRSGQFASRLSRITPAARCVPRMRWMPSARPRAAMSAKSPCSSGWSAEQRGELVDHHHQPREPHPGIEDVAGPCRRDGGLAAAQLGPQALDRASRSRAVEIRDDAGDVRHAGEAVEGRAALEVREQEGHLVGGARRAQREDPGDEQLALAGAGDARDHGVRPVRHEIDDGRPAAGDADRRGKAPRRRRARASRSGASASGSPPSRTRPRLRSARAASSAAMSSACARATASTRSGTTSPACSTRATPGEATVRTA